MTRVAGDQRRRDLAGGEHQRVVERDDPPDDAERLHQRVVEPVVRRRGSSRRAAGARARRSSAARAIAMLASLRISRIGLPFSVDVEHRELLRVLARSRSASASTQRARSSGLRRAPAGNAVARRARPRRRRPPRRSAGTLPITSPVAGLVASIVSPLRASRNSPPTGSATPSSVCVATGLLLRRGLRCRVDLRARQTREDADATQRAGSRSSRAARRASGRRARGGSPATGTASRSPTSRPRRRPRR